MTELLARAERAAVSPAKVLITGESGVGKNLVAQYIHSHSSRWLAPFVGVNCAGLTDARLESELFGRVKGNVPAPAPKRAASCSSRIAGRCFSTKSAT